MGLTVKIEYVSNIDELIRHYNKLRVFKNKNIVESTSISWDRGGITSYDLQTIFIGKTGYGKSTTLNKIIKNDVFETDDVSSCTKELHSAEFKINNSKEYYLSLCDLPGVGESHRADKLYMDWYRKILLKSNCVVYVLRADQRDFSIDEKLFNDIFRNKEEKKKVIIALNYIDKIEPINRKYPFTLTGQQLENVKEKVNTVSKIFGVNKKDIVYYSASENYNISVLMNKVAQKIDESL